MSELNVLNYVDHTQLKAFAVWADIQKLCEEQLHIIQHPYVSRPAM